MSGMFLSLLGLALLDSLNPSALAVTLYMLTQRGAHYRVAVYISAIFLTNLSLGLLLMLGLGKLLSSFGGALESPLAYAVQGIAGAAMLIYSLLAPNKAKADGVPPPSPRALGGTFLLGFTVTVLEFPTAFPYLGAVGILTGAALSPAQWFPILLVYNLIFILPPLLLLLAHMIFGERFDARFVSWQPRLQKEAKETMLWIVGIVGFSCLRERSSISSFSVCWGEI